MCTNEIHHDGNTFACRTCNECIASRKADWVSRAMAEKHTMGNALVLMLSYRNNADGTPPDGAKAFKYQDVQRFLYRLRKDYKKTYGKTGELTYICAGERGSTRGRVHYHIILFSVRPLTNLGQWTTISGENLQLPEMDQNQNWSHWEHGIVHPQEPNQGGMAYVLKYALKDQFSGIKSKGTMRYTKSENSAAGIFRMSKKPPIGMRFVQDQLSRWNDLQSVPPSLQIKIPDMTGYWHPRNTCRQELLQGLHHINEAVKTATGRESPQWQTLLASVSQDLKNLNDFETLVYGPDEIETTEGNENEQIEKFSVQLANSTRARERAQQKREVRRTCGGPRICDKCYRTLDPSERYALAEATARKQIEHEASASPLGFDRWYRAQHKANPFCQLRETTLHKEAFNA